MKSSKLLNKLSKLGGLAKVKFSKNAPTIFVVGGIIIGGVAAVGACIATKKSVPVIEEGKKTLDVLHQSMEEYGEDGAVSKKDIASVYTHYILEVAKLYAIPVSLAAVSVVSILAGNKILRDRYVAIAAGYTTVLKEFKDYRSRVREKYGEEADKLLRYGIEEIPVNCEDGSNSKIDMMTSKYTDPNRYSRYVKIFDETNPFYDKSVDYNKNFLLSQQSYFNNLLQADGHLFLNDVYKALGFLPTKEGQIVGWIYDPHNRDHLGDNYVDFGIIDVYNQKANDFVNGYERAIVLDFNVDGPIIDYI